MTSDLTSALEVSHIMRYTNRRILYFTLLIMGATRQCKYFNDVFNRFDTTLQRNRRTDGQTYCDSVIHTMRWRDKKIDA